jgi:hypothetical protein
MVLCHALIYFHKQYKFMRHEVFNIKGQNKLYVQLQAKLKKARLQNSDREQINRK